MILGLILLIFLRKARHTGDSKGDGSFNVYGNASARAARALNPWNRWENMETGRMPVQRFMVLTNPRRKGRRAKWKQQQLNAFATGHRDCGRQKLIPGDARKTHRAQSQAGMGTA